ncbi:MAG: TlpA family protein disulfide reductase [Chloroflexi bacterium]|nr:TlpA family protein disulfide reductase [Chloroflexota bacterium]
MSTETAPTTNEQLSGDKPQKKLQPVTIALWLVAIGVLALVGWGLMNANKTRPEQGQTAPGFVMEYFNGYEWEGRPSATLEDMRGKVVIVNFWASWCVECRIEADLLEQVWRQYQHDDLVMLGIAYSDVEPNALNYLKEFNVTYPNAPDLRTIISNDYEITGVPETFFIDKNGTIAHVQIGPVNQTTMTTLINRLLAE